MPCWNLQESLRWQLSRLIRNVGLVGRFLPCALPPTLRLSEPALKGLTIEKRRTRALRWSRLVRGSELSLQSEPLRLGRNIALDATSDFGRAAGKRQDA